MTVDVNFTNILERKRGIEPEFDRKRIETKLKMISQKVGGFKKYIIPEEFFGRGVMQDYRERTEEEIIHSFTDKILLLANSKNQLKSSVDALMEYPNEHYRPEVEQFEDNAFNILYESGFNKIAETFHYWRSINGFLRNGELNESQIPFEDFPSEKFKNDITLSYEKDNCNTAKKLNELLKDEKSFKELIEKREAIYEEDLRYLVRAFNNKEKAFLLAITGESSSGKSTTTERVSELLKEQGRRVFVISLDNYYKTNPPKTPRGDYLFEFPESLDLDLFVRDAHALFSGKPVKMTYYDFAKKERVKGQNLSLDIKGGDIVILDSLAALFRDVREIVPSENRFIAYLRPFNMIKPDERESNEYIERSYTNMFRRWLRDMRKTGRDTPIATNIDHWKTVRTGALRDIAPKIKLADLVINTGFPYEFNYIATKFNQIGGLPSPKYFLDRDMLSAAVYCLEAIKTISMFDPVPENYLSPEFLPDNSVIREFIGGSRYDVK
jgi:uridine kinase